MKKWQKLVLVAAVCLLACLLFRVRRTFARGLDKYLKDQPLTVGSVRLVPVTLRDGMESQKTPSWPLRNPNKVFEEPSFVNNEKRANKVGIDLRKALDQLSVSGYKDGNFYFLFYNFLTAGGCQNEYVIQRVRLDKEYFDYFGNLKNRQVQYLVEALALNFRKETKRADEHRREYRLGKFSKRKITIDFEVGCGEIPKKLTGKAWPNPKNPLYYRVQGYSDEPKLYDKVNYKFSSTYRIEIEMDQDGQYSLDLPY